MTKFNKVVCQAAALVLLLTFTTMPASAQFAGFNGGGGGDMMTQMAPMLNQMMKSKAGKRRLAKMMQTMGPMASQMMQNGGFGGAPGGFGGGGFGGPSGAFGGERY
jgi:hypothetical protein